MTSLRGPGDRNFNAVSHKPTLAPIQSVPVAPVSFGLWDTALKFLSPGPRNDVTDHLEVATSWECSHYCKTFAQMLLKRGRGNGKRENVR